MGSSHWLVKSNAKLCQDFTTAMDAVNVDLDEMRARVSCPRFPMGLSAVPVVLGGSKLGN